MALTFDSGSVAGSTAEIMDILRDNGIRTTFFITGQWAEDNPALVKRMVAEGHTVANHSYTHPDFTTISDSGIISELARTEDAIRRIAGVSSKPYFRPPFGAYDNRVLRVLGREGYKTIYWTLDSTDWREEATSESVRRQVVNNSAAGYIVVHHSAPEKTAKALPLIIRQLRERGLQIVNLPDLLGE
jgi:peptidoglycan/xylan/chitin deacetylase (PgdA/CDA1 family)